LEEVVDAMFGFPPPGALGAGQFSLPRRRCPLGVRQEPEAGAMLLPCPAG